MANYNPSHRYPGQPASGPTPTLNQLLQGPNPSQRYHQPNSYPEYAGQPQPKEPHLNQQQQQAWNSMRYNQQQQQQQIYRNQVSHLLYEYTCNSQVNFLIMSFVLFTFAIDLIINLPIGKYRMYFIVSFACLFFISIKRFPFQFN